MDSIPCCYCDFKGTERGVRVHMARRHSWPLAMALMGAHGRPPRGACPRCRLVHDDIARPGWAQGRKKLERPHVVHFSGRIPKGSGGRFLTVGRAIVPPNVSRLKRVVIWADRPARMRLVIRDPSTGKEREVLFDCHGGPVKEPS